MFILRHYHGLHGGNCLVGFEPLPYYGWTTFPSVLWCCWLGLLTCKTASRITYTVLVETLNSAQSNLCQLLQTRHATLDVPSRHRIYYWLTPTNACHATWHLRGLLWKLPEAANPQHICARLCYIMQHYEPSGTPGTAICYQMWWGASQDAPCTTDRPPEKIFMTISGPPDFQSKNLSNFLSIYGTLLDTCMSKVSAECLMYKKMFVAETQITSNYICTGTYNWQK